MGSLGVIQTATSAPLPCNDRAEEQGFFDNALALLDALAERYVEEGRVAGMVNVAVTAILFRAQVIDLKVMIRSAIGLFRIYSMTAYPVAAMQLYEQEFHQRPREKFVPELAGLKVLNARAF